MADEIAIAGTLWKKSTGGFKGLRRWKKTYCRVTMRKLYFHEKQGGPVIAQVNLLDIRSIQELPNKRLGDRFDILIKNGAVYAMHSASRAETLVWIKAFDTVIAAAKQEEKEQEKKTNILDAPGRDKKFTGLQRLFFDAWFGESKMTVQSTKETFRETQAILADIDKNFATESDVIRFLLLSLMAPALNIVHYDTEEPEVKEGITMGSKVSELVNHAGTLLNIKVDDVLKAFDDHLIFDVRDLVEAYVPAAVPQKVSAKIKEILEEIKEGKANSTETKAAAPLPPTATPQERLVAMVKSPQMMRNLVVVFGSADTQVHSLAMRLLWAIYHCALPASRALPEFCAQVSVQCGGPRLSTASCSALLAFALEGHGAITNLVDLDHLQFNRQINCVAVLKPLLAVLKGAKIELWKVPLSDITALLHDNIRNTELMAEGNDWQLWLLHLLTEFPKKARSEEPGKSIFALIVNNFTLIHFNYFVDSDKFAAVIHSTIFRVHHFGGSNRTCQSFLNILLGAMLSKLTAQKNVFGADYSTSLWTNLVVLLGVLRKFVFQSAYWQSAPLLGQLRSDMAASNEDAEALVEMEAAQFLMLRRPLGKTARTWNSEVFDMRDFGVHWEPGYEGPCVDLDLPKKITLLLQKLDVTTFTDDLMYGKSKRDREFLAQLQGEFEFWEDADTFLHQLRREDISRRHVLSYRRLGHFCQSFCQENRAGRTAIMKRHTRLLAAGAGDTEDELPEGFSTREFESPVKPEEDAGTTSPRPTGGANSTNSQLSTPSMRRIQTGGNAPISKARPNIPHSGSSAQFNNNSVGSSSCTSSSCIGFSESPPQKPEPPKVVKPASPRKPDPVPLPNAALLSQLSGDLDDK